jgi:hypothetical protein
MGITKPRDALDQRLDDQVLKVVGLKLLLLSRVRDESHLDQDGRHVGAHEHPEGRLLYRARTHGHALTK